MNYKRKQIDKALQAAEMSFICGGSWLGAVRSWMQRTFRNGERVIWGSDEELTDTSLTPRDMEQLAESIKNSAVRQFKQQFESELKRLETSPW